MSYLVITLKITYVKKNELLKLYCCIVCIIKNMNIKITKQPVWAGDQQFYKYIVIQKEEINTLAKLLKPKFSVGCQF